MSEKDVVERSQKAYTKDMIKEDLRQLGVQKDDILLVHSSLSSLGWVVGREVTVVEALLEVVSEGTIVMPSFTGDNTDPTLWNHPAVPSHWIDVIKENMPPFDSILTPTREMGKIVESFRHYPGVVRSLHPQVSFVAYGMDAIGILNDHALTPGLGIHSPLQKLYDKNAKVLLLGVGYGNCTCLHLSESQIYPDKTIHTGARMILHGKSQWVDFEEIDYDDRSFERIGKDFEKRHHVCIGNVGEARCRLISLREICDFGYSWMKERNG